MSLKYFTIISQRLTIETYHVEALCLMGRAVEAAEFLENEFTVHGHPSYSSSYPGSLGVVDVNEVDEAKAVGLFNHGVKCAMLGRIPLAQKLFVDALKVYPHSPMIIKGLIYTLLQTGQVASALQVLRRGR